MVMTEADRPAEVSGEPATERHLARFSGWANIAYWIVAAVATALVTAQAYSSTLFNASFRYDEINVIVSIIDRTYARLHPPLDFGQSAPIGWLWLEKAAVDLFGNNEVVLRLPSVLASAGALILTAFLARRLLPPLGALVAFVFVASNYYLAYYAYNAKPYALDMVCSVALVLAGLAARRQREVDGTGVWVAARRSSGTIIFWAVATVTSFFSYPAVFATAAIALVLGVERMLRAGGWRPAFRAGLVFTAAAIPWFVMVGLVYIFAMRATAGSDFLYDYFADAFPGAGIKGRLKWLAGALFLFGRRPLSPAAPWLAALIVVGAVVLLIRRRWDAGVLVAPVAMGFVLAGLRIYPMADRLSMYALPLAAVLMLGFTNVPRTAVAALLQRKWSWRPIFAFALAIVLVVPVVWQVQAQLTSYYPTQNRFALRTWTQTRELVSYLQQHQRPGDIVLAGPTDEVGFRYYGKRVGLPAPSGYILLRKPGAQCSGTEIRPVIASATRVWIVTLFGNNKTPYVKQNKVLGAFGPVEESLHLQYGRVDAYKVVNRNGPDVNDAALQAATDGLSCIQVVKPPFAFPPPR